MQTLSPTISAPISPAIAKTVNPSNSRVSNVEADFLPALSQSLVLQTALTGMDASLNDELDRYRHWQANGQNISYLNPFRPRAISTQLIWTSPSLSDALAPIAPPTDNNSDKRSIQMPVMPPLAMATSPSLNISSAELHKDKGLDSFNNLENIGLDETSAYAQNLNDYAGAGMDFDSPTMAKVPAPDDDEILQSFANDYSESYQDSINQESQVPIPQTEKSLFRSLMNPVGIISLLLLLFSSAAIGYLLVDPSGVMKIFKPDSRPKTAQTDSSNQDLGSDINLQNQQKSQNSSLSFVPFAGDKTQSSQTVDSLTKNNKALTNSSLKPSSLFVPNNTSVPNAPLRTVPSTSFPAISVAPLPPASMPFERSSNPPESRNYEAPDPSYREPAPRNLVSPPATPNRATSSPATPTTVYVTPIAPAYVAPRDNSSVKYAAPLTSAPANSTPVSSAPVNSTSANSGTPSTSYRVVVENNYAASAQKVERDAYVRPSDGQVQVGSYRDANAAQHRIEHLRRQGIPARMEQ